MNEQKVLREIKWRATTKKEIRLIRVSTVDGNVYFVVSRCVSIIFCSNRIILVLYFSILQD